MRWLDRYSTFLAVYCRLTMASGKRAIILPPSTTILWFGSTTPVGSTGTIHRAWQIKSTACKSQNSQGLLKVYTIIGFGLLWRNYETCFIAHNVFSYNSRLVQSERQHGNGSRN